MIATNAPRYNSLAEYIAECKSKDAHRARLADKLFHTVRSGLPDEIRQVMMQCLEAKIDFANSKHDYLLEYFDAFRRTTTPPEINIVRLITHYQKRISNKAKLSFYQNVYYRRLLDDASLTEFSNLLNGERY